MNFILFFVINKKLRMMVRKYCCGGFIGNGFSIWGHPLCNFFIQIRNDSINDSIDGILRWLGFWVFFPQFFLIEVLRIFNDFSNFMTFLSFVALSLREKYDWERLREKVKWEKIVPTGITNEMREKVVKPRARRWKSSLFIFVHPVLFSLKPSIVPD